MDVCKGRFPSYSRGLMSRFRYILSSIPGVQRGFISPYPPPPPLKFCSHACTNNCAVVMSVVKRVRMCMERKWFRGSFIALQKCYDRQWGKVLSREFLSSKESRLNFFYNHGASKGFLNFPFRSYGPEASTSCLCKYYPTRRPAKAC